MTSAGRTGAGTIVRPRIVRLSLPTGLTSGTAWSVFFRRQADS